MSDDSYYCQSSPRELPPVNKTYDQQSDQLEGNQIMNLFQK
jgi:hypothetical protein